MRVDSISDLLAAITQLPATEKRVARERVAAAIELPAAEARAALGLLALDVVGQLEQATSARVIVLPDAAAAVAVSA